MENIHLNITNDQCTGNFRTRHNPAVNIMITLRGKLKKDSEVSKTKDINKRASVRDKLLVKEVKTRKFRVLVYEFKPPKTEV